MGPRGPAHDTASMSNAQPMHVFIVDDAPAIRVRLHEMLDRIAGVLVVGEASSAREAISGILRLHPDSVLLDLNLYGRTGIDVLKAVHAEAPDIAFVVLTNHAEPQYRRACTEAGARYFLDKSREFTRVPEVIAEIASARP